MYSFTPTADISVVVCDASKLSILLEKADHCPKLKHIVKIGDVSEEDVQNAGKFGITIKSFKDVEVMLAIAQDCYLRFTYCLNKCPVKFIFRGTFTSMYFAIFFFYLLSNIFKP